jgi:spermidine synthase
MNKREGFEISSLKLLLLAFSEGAAVMALELIGGRMIAPAYGSSLIVWTTVLGITMAALALGYYIGAQISSTTNITDKIIFLFLSSGLFILIMPKIASFTINHFDAESLFLSVFLSSLCFLFLPIVALGATTPLIVSLLTNKTIGQGKASGRVYGASTIGGIVFTFLVGFWFVPDYGLSVTAFITSILISLIPVFLAIKIKGFKYSLIIVLYIIIGVPLTFSKEKVNGVKIIHQSEGLLGQLLVVDQVKQNNEQGIDRILFVNRMGQTWIDKKTGNSIWTYPNYVAVLASSLKENPDVLILGIGGGTMAELLHKTLNANIETVELDSRIEKIARQNFNLNQRVKVHIDDARHFIRTSNKKYDLIIFDVFKGEVPPAHVLTVECFQEARKNLNEDGFMIINFNGFIDGSKGKAGRALAKTILDAGYALNMFPTFGTESERNILYIASPKKKDFAETKIHLNVFNKEVRIDTMQLPFNKINFTPEDKSLTDDYPVLELLNLEAAQTWRKDYNDNYTKQYTKKGVPVFK